MSHTMYLECYSGISGDMLAAALLDLGADWQVLEEVLNSLPVSGFQAKVSRVMKSGIDACDFNVILSEQDNHDHDMQYLYGHLHGEYSVNEGHAHEHSHHHSGEEHSHEHAGHEHPHHYGDEEHSDGHSHHHGGEQHSHEHAGHEHSHHQNGEGHTHAVHPGHVHRGMREIQDIIGQGKMTEGARALALKIFGVLAEAESKAHHVPVEEVHFHEVGALDSIVDIVSIAVCLDNLGVTKVIVPELWEGKGTVRCQHGILPVPVPAVCNIMETYGLPLKITDIMGELVTPTGAAAVAAIKTEDRLPEHFVIQKTGLGAGKRQYACPGILRAMLIEEK